MQVHKIIVYASNESLWLLAKADNIYIDGEPVPGCSITIHAFFHGQQFPLIYCLLPSKSWEVYNSRRFDTLKTVLQQWGYVLEPTSVVADFERALIQSVELQFPTSTTKGCFYHYTQAIWRKVQNLGMQGADQDDEDVKKFIQKCTALANQVCQNCMARSEGRSSSHSCLDELISYMKDTWIAWMLPMWMSTRPRDHILTTSSKVGAIA